MELRQVRHQKAGIIIGKNRLSDGIIKSIKENVKKHGIVKIKILKSALSIEYTKENLISDIVTATNFHVIEQRGYTVIISNPSI